MSGKRGKGGEDAGAEGLGWLQALEDRVREATGRLRELGEENARLRERVEELESDLAAAGEAAAGDGAGAADAGADAEAWQREREEIRGRVERLTGSLEDLLAGSGGDDD